MTLHLLTKRNAKRARRQVQGLSAAGRYVFDYTGDIWQREKLAILDFGAGAGESG